MSATAVPADVLAALDRLNGHARAHGCGKTAVYTYKKLAAMQAAIAGELAARPVTVTVPCQRCGGTGRYRPWWDDDATRGCFGCGARGQVRLDFVETTIGAYVWHHPYTDAGHDILRAAWSIATYDYERDGTIAVLADGTRRAIVYESPGDWRPNRGGERLSGDDAARLLNPVEAWVASLPALVRGDPWWWQYEAAQRAIARYALDLGRVGEACWCCGASEVTNLGIGHRSGRLHFALRICGRCYNEPRRWPTEEDVPASAITPAIRAWLDNPARSKKAAS